jgi:hypothetical protein
VIRRVGSFEHRTFEVELGRGGEQDRAGEVLPHRWNNNGPTRQREIFKNGSALRVGPAGEVLPIQVEYVEDGVIWTVLAYLHVETVMAWLAPLRQFRANRLASIAFRITRRCRDHTGT